MDMKKLRGIFLCIKQKFKRGYYIKYEVDEKNCDIQCRLRLHKEEFHKYSKYIKRRFPICIILIFFIGFILYKFVGVEVFSIYLAILFSLSGIFELFFLKRIEKRIINPIRRLKSGFEDITNGNYDVKIDVFVNNEIGFLIDSFNFMAEKLKQNEIDKQLYEENRKMLIANISHDLKTPITSILGYVEAINDRDEYNKEYLSKYLKIIQNNSEYMNKLIDDLFLFTQLDLQKLNIEIKKVSAKSFFEDFLEELKLEYIENTYNFDFDIFDDNDVYIEIDGKRLQQIFINILNNSIKYSNKDKLEIKIYIKYDQNNIIIEICDNGEGIPAQKLQHIFERFYRIDNERTKDCSSTGLGLAIAKELVEVQKGKIFVESEVMKFTKFTILFPINNNEVNI